MSTKFFFVAFAILLLAGVVNHWAWLGLLGICGLGYMSEKDT